MYEPELARFTSRDPLSENGSMLLPAMPNMRQTAGHSPYAYADNNPINRLDPTGLFPITVQVDAFIPWAWISFAGINQFKGDNRTFMNSPPPSSSSRVTTFVRVEMEECRPPTANAKHTYLSPSTMRWKIGPFTFGEETRMGTKWDKVAGKRTGPCSVMLYVRTTGTVPWTLAPGAPSIDWEFKFSLHIFEIVNEGAIVVSGVHSGKHDGFPAYEVFVEDRRVYAKEPDGTVFSLFPPMEKEVANNKIAFILKGKKAECCDCKGTREDWRESFYKWYNQLESD